MSAWLPLRSAGKRAASLIVGLGIVVAGFGSPALSNAEDDLSADPRTFAQTGYRIDNDAFWSYFNARGGAVTFGYPVSRDFLFLGCTSQFFQRLVMQQCGTQGVGTLNLLDDGLLPYTHINGSTFPGSDNLIRAATPRVSDPSYGTQILDFVRGNTADTFDGEPVNFQTTFFSTISPETAGTDDPNILGLLSLEMWGAPTSKPAYDPNNRRFIYQRFQRGIMHYDKGCGCTQGLLLADYLKSLLTGQNLPADLAAQAATSPLLGSAAANGKAPSATVFANAFTPGGTSPTIPDNIALARLPTPAPTTTVTPGVAVSSPDYGLSMFLWGQTATTARDLGIATSIGFHWQKTLFQWRAIEGACKGCFDWKEADRVVQASKQAGVHIIARIDFQPDWARADHARNGPPDRYQDYVDFVSALVSRYSPGSAIGPVDAIEVWNEVNLTREWGDQPINPQQASDYVRLLGMTYRAAHAINPSITIITAGLSPTGVKTNDAWDDAEYLQWLFNAGLKGGVNYDVLGAHGNTQAPEVDAPLNSLPQFPHPSFYFRRIEQLRDLQVTNGDASRQIWLLEFGWTADHIHPDYSWFAVTEDQKAANIVKAFQYAKAHWTPWIGVMSLWTLSDPGWSATNEQYWWAIDNPDGSARSALTAIQSARKSGTL